MSNLKEFEAHIKDKLNCELNKKISFCGEITNEFMFEDASHAVMNRQREGRLLPCKKCVKKIIELLNTR